MDNARAPWDVSRVHRALFSLVAVLVFFSRYASAGVAEELDRVRRDPVLASDGAAIDALVREADASPPSVARTEAWSLAAEAYASRLQRPSDAAQQREKILSDASSDPVLAQKAARDLVTYYLASGDVLAARNAARRDPGLARDIARFERRRVVRIGSIAALSALALSAGAAIARARRRVLAPLKQVLPFVIAHAFYTALVGALLASGYESGNALPFVVFGAVLPPLLILARAWAAAGSPSPSARSVRAFVAASAVLASAFLTLDRIDVAYLEGLGL